MFNKLYCVLLSHLEDKVLQFIFSDQMIWLTSMHSSVPAPSVTDRGGGDIPVERETPSPC